MVIDRIFTKCQAKIDIEEEDTKYHKQTQSQANYCLDTRRTVEYLNVLRSNFDVSDMSNDHCQKVNVSALTSSFIETAFGFQTNNEDLALSGAELAQLGYIQRSIVLTLLK